MTTPVPPPHGPFVADAGRLLAAGAVDVPGRDLRTGDTAWVDVDARTDRLTVTLFPVGAEHEDFAGLWVVAAQAGRPCRYGRLDRNGQCVLDLQHGRWDLRLLAPDARAQPPVRRNPAADARAQPAGRGLRELLGPVSGDDPIACCAALDELRATATDEVWEPADIAPVVAQLRDNPEAMVRRAAAELLGEVGGPAAVPVLLVAVDDPAWSVQCAAVVGLGLIGDRDTFRLTGLLAGVFGDDSRDPAVREAAGEALDRLDGGNRAPLGEHSAVPLHSDPADPPPSLSIDTAMEAAQRIGVVEPTVGSVVEHDVVALLVHPDPADPGTVVVAVEPGDGTAGLVASLWAVGQAFRVHSGPFDRHGRLRLRDVPRDLRYEVRIHRPGQDTDTRTVRQLAARSTTPVLVRSTTDDPDHRSESLLVVSDPDGRTAVVARTADDRIVVEVTGLGITDRRLVVRLPIRAGSAQLLAPLRWNHHNDRCEARLELHDTDEITDDAHLTTGGPDALEPGDAIALSISRARPETVEAWAALAAEPALHPQLAASIRAALADRGGAP